MRTSSHQRRAAVLIFLLMVVLGDYFTHGYNLNPREREIRKQQKGQPKNKKKNGPGPSPSPGPEGGSRPISGDKGSASAPLVLLPTPPAPAGPGYEEGKGERTVKVGSPTNVTDPVIQTGQPNPGGNVPDGIPFTGFEGLGNVNGVFPSDANGAVGTNHYIEIVNIAFAIYTKAGTLIYGPSNINTLWANSGIAACTNQNSGDPIVLYDKWADRWIISQFTVQSAYPYGECVAVSATGNPLGSWYRYFFNLSDREFYDYPKMAIWLDSYIFTFTRFLMPEFEYTGPSILVISKADMISNVASPRAYEYQLNSNQGVPIPADVDGWTQPPVGTPHPTIAIRGTDLFIWKTFIDWSAPANNYISSAIIIPGAPFNQACYGHRCILQPSPGAKLEAMGDRLMYRFSFRIFPDGHDAAVIGLGVNVNNGTGDVGGLQQVGIRWYELRNLISPTTQPYIYQEGTWSPDLTHFRYVPALALDKRGNIAMGYSISSTTTYCSIAITGYLVDEPLNLMSIPETFVAYGTGVQTTTQGRWGDYFSMAIDPVDDCTFYYTGQYQRNTGGAPWSTYVAKFQLPGCNGVPTPAPSPAPTAPTFSPTGAPTSPTMQPTTMPSNLPTVAPPGYCANPHPITVGANKFSNSATGTTVNMGGTTGCTFPFNPQSISNVNYYSFVPPSTAAYVFSTCNSANFDTKLSVQTTCEPSNGVLTCNDDYTGCAGYTSQTQPITLQQGQMYYLLVGGYDSTIQVGSGTITVTQSTPSPTPAPTPAPTTEPSMKPTAPTPRPTSNTNTPTRIPTRVPTRLSLAPTKTPTSPTIRPTKRPTSPTKRPTKRPTERPSRRPTTIAGSPTKRPSRRPTARPSRRPTTAAASPTIRPSRRPTVRPSRRPTTAAASPTVRPSRRPTARPSRRPTV